MVLTPVGFGKHHLSHERRAELEATARGVASYGKGIAACDEGAGTIGDRCRRPDQICPVLSESLA